MRAIKNWTIRLFAVAISAAILFVFWTTETSVLPVDVAWAKEEARSYFVTSPTAYAKEKATLSPFDLPFVQGEKVQYLCEKEGDRDEFIADLLERFDAYDVWTEEADGVISYYASSTLLPKKVSVDGHTVSLHIALLKDGRRVVVGTPIIFGGY